MGVQMHLHDWLPETRLGYQGVSYWVVPWGASLKLRLGSRLSQMMADDWVVPLAPLRLSVIISSKAMLMSFNSDLRW